MCGPSLVSSVLLIVLYRKLTRIQRTPGWLMVRAASCDAVVSAIFIVLYALYGDLFGEMKAPQGAKDHILLALVLALGAFELAGTTWRMLVYFDLFTIYRNPFFPDRHRGMYPLYVTIVAGSLTAIVASVSGFNTPKAAEERGVFLVCFSFVFAPILLVVLLGGSLYVGVRLLIRNVLRDARRDGHAPSISFLARQRIMRHGSAYLIAHGVQLLACLILILVSPDGQNQNVWHVLICLICGRPTLSFLGWLIINDIPFLLCGVCSFTKPWRELAAEESRRREPGWRRLNSGAGGAALLTPRLLPVEPAGGVEESRRRGFISWMLSASEEAREWRRNGGKEDVGFQAELRFELLYDVAVGIGELAQEEKAEADDLRSRNNSVEPWRASVDLGMISGGRAEPMLTARRSDPRLGASGNGRYERTGSLDNSTLRSGIASSSLQPLCAAQSAVLQADRVKKMPEATSSTHRRQADMGAADASPRQYSRHISLDGSSCISPTFVCPETSARNAAGTSGAGHSATTTLSPRPGSFFTPPPTTCCSDHAPTEPLPHITPLPQLTRSHSEGRLEQMNRVTSAHDQPRSHAQHYEVNRFRRLRNRFGVTAANYARAFPDDLTELGSNWRQRLNESVSEGKSGSFFYRVAGAQFIVKQISRSEKATLMAILPEYEEYITRRQGRSLIHYYGCHSMSLRWRFSEKVYFIVMRNFLPAVSAASPRQPLPGSPSTAAPPPKH